MMPYLRQETGRTHFPGPATAHNPLSPQAPPQAIKVLAPSADNPLVRHSKNIHE